MDRVKVWDCFPMWRELWAYRARLALWAEFAPDVDYQAVPLLGDRTHRGDPLPLEVMALWNDLPHNGYAMVTLDAGSDWGREEQQRDAVVELRPRMADDDLVLLGDADELVDPRALAAIVAATEDGPCKLEMALYFYGTRWRYQRPWRHAGACRARDLPASVSKSIRLAGHTIVPDAGWHISYVGDGDQKLRAFAHSEVDNEEFRATLAAGPDLGTSPGGREALADDPLPEDIARLIGV